MNDVMHNHYTRMHTHYMTRYMIVVIYYAYSCTREYGSVECDMDSGIWVDCTVKILEFLVFMIRIGREKYAIAIGEGTL